MNVQQVVLWNAYLKMLSENTQFNPIGGNR